MTLYRVFKVGYSVSYETEKEEKMKRVTLLFLLLLAGIFILHCQERKNRENASFAGKGVVINYGTGWAFNNQSRKWINNDRVISDMDWSFHYPLKRDVMAYEFIGISPIEYAGINYFVFYYETKYQRYDHPKNGEERDAINCETRFIVLSENEYKDIIHYLKSKSNNAMTLKTFVYGIMIDCFGDDKAVRSEYYNGDVLMKEVTLAILTKNNKPLSMVIKNDINNNDKVVRFRLPEKNLDIGMFKHNYFEIVLPAAITLDI